MVRWSCEGIGQPSGTMAVFIYAINRIFRYVTEAVLTHRQSKDSPLQRFLSLVLVFENEVHLVKAVHTTL